MSRMRQRKTALARFYVHGYPKEKVSRADGCPAQRAGISLRDDITRASKVYEETHRRGEKDAISCKQIGRAHV